MLYLSLYLWGLTQCLGSNTHPRTWLLTGSGILAMSGYGTLEVCFPSVAFLFTIPLSVFGTVTVLFTSQ